MNQLFDTCRQPNWHVYVQMTKANVNAVLTAPKHKLHQLLNGAKKDVLFDLLIELNPEFKRQSIEYPRKTKEDIINDLTSEILRRKKA